MKKPAVICIGFLSRKPRIILRHSRPQCLAHVRYLATERCRSLGLLLQGFEYRNFLFFNVKEVTNSLKYGNPCGHILKILKLEVLHNLNYNKLDMNPNDFKLLLPIYSTINFLITIKCTDFSYKHLFSSVKIFYV